MTMDVCGALLNRMMYGRGEHDTNLLSKTVLCLPAICVAFPSLMDNAITLLSDLLPSKDAAQLLSKKRRFRNGNNDDSKNAKRRVTLLPSATDVFLNDTINNNNN